MVLDLWKLAFAGPTSRLSSHVPPVGAHLIAFIEGAPVGYAAGRQAWPRAETGWRRALAARSGALMRPYQPFQQHPITA